MPAPGPNLVQGNEVIMDQAEVGRRVVVIGGRYVGMECAVKLNVIVSTGLTHRLYTNAATPSRMFNTSHCPNCAGGQARRW